MTNDIKAKVTDTARQVAPWKKGIPWWVVLIEGIILLGLGFYMFFAKPTTLALLGWIIALALAAGGALSLYLALRATDHTPSRKWTLVHGAVGLGASVLVMLFRLLGWFSVETAAIILGVGCLVYGGMGLYPLLDQKLVPLRRVSLIGAIFFTILGVLLILQAFGVGTLVTTVQIITLVVIIAGVVLVLWSLMLRNSVKAS